MKAAPVLSHDAVSSLVEEADLCERWSADASRCAQAPRGEGEMVRVTSILAAVGAAWVFASAAAAGVSLNAARVGAEDVQALANFYESAFGMQEVNRLQFPGMLEIMLNFGGTVQAAKGNPRPQIVIMHRASNAIDDPVPHLIFNVTDMTATAAAIQAAGGQMNGKPRPFGKTGIVIGLARDPAGNRLELIQQPKR
jgi:predicted enzyme related to lactoylglutathione lyase